MRPDVEDLVVPLLLRDAALLAKDFCLLNFLLRALEDRGLAMRHPHVVLAERESRERRGLEAERLDVVEDRDRRLLAEELVAVGDDLRDGLLLQGEVVV